MTNVIFYFLLCEKNELLKVFYQQNTRTSNTNFLLIM